MAAETELVVKIASGGAGQTVRDVLGVQKAIAQLGKDSKDAAALAKQLGAAYNLPDDQVAALAKALGQARSATEGAADAAGNYRDSMGRLRNENGKFVTESVDGFKRVDGAARTLGGTLDQVLTGFFEGLGRKGVDLAVNSIQGLGAAIADTVGKASKEFGGFDAALTSFSAKSGIARGDLAALEDEAVRLAAVTSQTPTTVAELGTALLTLGADADQATSRLEGIVKLADVIGEDPVLTGKVVQTGLTIYEEFGETADTVSDKINTLINTTAAGSSGGVGEFLQLFQTAAPAAKALGVDLDDLSSAFATLRDTGASAEVASTGLKIALLSLANPTGQSVGAIKELGLEAFDANGEFVGLQEALTQFADATANVSDQKRVELAAQIFGREGAPAILSLLDQVQGRYTTTANALAESNGSVAESLEVINQGIERQRELLEGQLSGAYTKLGAAIAPVQAGLLGFASELLTATTEGSSGLGELNAAAERFRQSIADNPALLEAVASALAQIADIITGTVSSALNALADQIGSLSEDDLQQLSSRFVETIETVVGLASQIGQVVLVFGELAANIGGGATDAFNNLAPAIGAVVEFLGAVLAAVRPLTENTELLSVAMQVLFIRMIAIQGLALATSLKATTVALIAKGVAAKAAAGGLAAFGTAAAVAAAPLVVLAAAVAAVNFIKFTRDLKVANDSLDAYIGGVDVAGNQAFSFANKLRNLNEEIAEAGGQATDEQLKKLEEFKKLSQAQVDDLQQQLSEVQAFEPKNDAQRQSQANLIQQLETSINALNGQIEKSEATLSEAAAGVGEATGVALGEAFSAGLEQELGDEPGEKIEDALKRLGDSTKTALDELSTDAANARAAILESGGDQAKLAALEAKTLQDRIQANRDFFRELQALESQGGLSAEEAASVADQIRAVDAQLASDRVSLAQASLAEQKRLEQERVKVAKQRADEERRVQQERVKEEQRQGVEARKDARDEQRRAEDKAAQQELQEADRAFQEQRRAEDAAAQKQAQDQAKAFQQQQQAAAAAFQQRQQAEQDQAGREFGVLTSEVERRIKLQEAASQRERNAIKDQFKEEDKQLEKRRKVEEEVLRDQAKILRGRDEETKLGPLEQAQRDFEAEQQAEAAKFQAQQQKEQEVFAQAQAEVEEARRVQRQAEDLARAEELEALKDARDEQRRAEDRAFEENERQIQGEFAARQRQEEEAFKERQRQLDEASAQRIASNLAAARPAGIDGARKDGGSMKAGGTYLVGEEGPELVTPSRRGHVHTARETAALLAGVPVRGAAVQVPQVSTGAVEAKLDKLIAVVQQRGRVQAGPTSYTLNTQNPQADAIAMQMAALKALVRAGGL